MSREKQPPRIMSVKDYAEARGLKPQLIHYYIRTEKLLPEDCECGRQCVNVAETDEFFRRKALTQEERDAEDIGGKGRQT